MGDSLRRTLALAGKEARGYFGSPIAWVMMGLFAVIYGYFFNVYLDFFVRNAMQSQMGGAPSNQNVNMDMIRPLLQNASVIILFLVPMVTMRTYSEEKRSGTIELLLTSPITDLDIVLGKFFGAIGLYLGLLAVTAVYVGMLFLYSRPEITPLISGYLGLLLLGGCFVAIGLFVSSLTKNQMVAGVGTFVVLLLLWIINWMADSAGPWLGEIMRYLSITEHFDDFGKGVIDTKHLVFYLSVIVFGLFLTLKSVDSERWRG